MTKTIAAIVVLVLLAAGSTAYALYSVAETGTWPKSWPSELEPLRKQSRTLVGPTMAFQHFAVPFTDRDDFEASWPHMLKVKTKGAPIFLVRGPNFFLGENHAGVVIHCPPKDQRDNPKTPEAPIENATNPRVRWLYTNYIELVVDGKIVDLNRILLPRDTPIIDERFAETDEQSDECGEGQGLIVAADKKEPSVEGVIVQLNQPGTILVKISAGSDDGLKTGDIFVVSRKKRRIGKLKIATCESDRSTANIIDVHDGEILRVGDSVGSKP